MDIKLGVIKDGKLVKYGKGLTWNLDINIAIFIRDSLKEFVEDTHGIPQFLLDNHGWDPETISREQEDQIMDEWKATLNHIIEDLDYYIKDPFDLLPEEYKDLVRNGTPVSREVVEQTTRIMRRQQDSAAEAFKTLGEVFYYLWD